MSEWPNPYRQDLTVGRILLPNPARGAWKIKAFPPLIIMTGILLVGNKSHGEVCWSYFMHLSYTRILPLAYSVYYCLYPPIASLYGNIALFTVVMFTEMRKGVIISARLPAMMLCCYSVAEALGVINMLWKHV